ncbi:MAG: hypothetical protein ISR58_10080 [Anaerolineales bacterium]|nr:hypothetical protein [Chloroflexota bacterium]MBL6981522.1 hypothetical protein [Anaerolineales bacterium]
MVEKANNQEAPSSIPESAFNSSINELEIPSSVQNLLEGNGYSNVGDLMLDITEDEKKLLAVRGIGPKILEQIIFAVKQFEIPEEDTVQVKLPQYNPPVPALADYFKPPPGNNVDVRDDDRGKAEENVPSYNPPVPSLADYFDPESVITSVKSIKEHPVKIVPKEKTPKKKSESKKKAVTIKKISKNKKKSKDKQKAKKKNKKKSKPKQKRKKSSKKSEGKKKK